MHFTQNPIGSDDQLDLQDNAISFDYAMNSPAALWQDRFGKQHKTVQQALKDVGFKPAGFDFVSGGTLGIGDRDKCVFYPTDGYWYSWNGKLPYVVPVNSSPTPGGKKGWGVVTRDERVIAREALRRTYQEAGYNLVEGSFEAGGALVKANDVLLQERTGKVFSGPAGTVPAGTDPASGGFVDKSEGLLRHELATSDGAAKVGNANGGSVQDFIDTQTFPNVAAMLDFNGLQVGQQVEWRGYYSANDGGGNVGIVKIGAHTPDGGSIFSVDANTYIEANFDGDEISVRQFGAVGKGNTDDYQSIQNTINKALSLIKKDTTGTTILGTAPKVVFRNGIYEISQTVDASAVDCGYLNYYFDGSIIRPHSTFDHATYGIDMYCWQNKVSDLKMVGFDKALYLHNPNINGGRISFPRLTLHSCKIGITLDTRSSTITVSDFNFRRCEQILYLVRGDKVTFRDGWIDSGIIPNSFDGMFNIGEFAHLTLDNTLVVPIVGQPANVAVVWIRTSASVRISKSLFGGEAGAIPAVTNHARQDTYAGLPRGIQIAIADSSIYSSSGGPNIPMVELYELPNSISLTNVTGGIESSHNAGLIKFNDALHTFSDAEARTYYKLGITVDGATPINYFGLPVLNNNTLGKYFRTESPVIFDYAKDVSNASPKEVILRSVAGRGRSWKMIIINPINVGVDRLSEYFITSSGSAPGTLYIAPIREGTSTVAGRARLNASGNIEVFPNSSATTDLAVQINQVGTVTENYIV